MATTAFLQKAYLAYFGRPVDFTGTTAFANSTELQVQNAFSASAESQALYGSTFGAAQINAIYLVLFGRAAEPAGLAYWSNQVQLGLLTPAGAAVGILNGALNADAIAVTNKLDASAKFTIGLDTTAKILGYSGNVAAASARDFLATVTATPVTPAQVDSGVSVAVVAGTANTNAGTTFTLTAGVDNIVGTAGNDTIIGDNTVGSPGNTVSVGDQISGGAGTDTFKFYVTAAQDLTALALPQLTSVENLYVKGGVFTAKGTADFSAIAGLNSIELDSPAVLASGTAADAFVIKTTAAQTVKLDNVNTITAKTSFVALSAASALTVNAIGNDTTNNGVVTIDLASTTATSASIAATGAASKVTLTNSGAKVATLSITGDQNLALTEGLTTLKTINASAATGKVSVDVSTITVDAAFVFTGGSAADTLTLSEAGLNALTAGSQISGGAGIDTLKINQAAGAFTAADYKAINAASSFEILGLGTTAGDTVDASQLTTIKEFGVFGGTNTISKVATGSILDIFAATKTTVSGAVGVSDLTINIGTAASTTGTSNTTLDITGLTSVTINSSIKAGTVGAANVIGTLTQSDNSTFTIKGNGDTTLALGAATVTGSKIDGSAATGKLALTGNTAAFSATKVSLGDILIGGSGNDTLTTGANSSTLTGGAGNDSFVVAATVVGSATAPAITTITDFIKGDSIKFDANFVIASVFNKVDLSGLAAGQTDVQVFTALAAKSAAAGSVEYGVYNGVTYVLEDNNSGTANGTFDAKDIAVKLTGVLDLTTSTHAADTVLVFA